MANTGTNTTAENAGDGSNSDGKTTEQQQPKLPATQEELNALLEGRLARERSKYAGYDELKAKAEKFDKIEDTNKTEAQREKDRADRAEQEAATLRADLLRTKVAGTKGVPPELLTGSTEDELNAAADKLLAFRGEQQGDGKRKRQAPGSSSLERTDTEVTKGDTASLFASFMQDSLKN